ncbi:MAG: FmdB family transcriptional regulator [Pirellulales bacterium]
MPIYVYEVILPDGSAGEQIEVFQKMSDAPLTCHPDTGQPVQRVLTAANIGGSWSDASMGKRMSDDKKLDSMGFTKYVKAGDGYYEKRAGKGPDVLHKDSPIDASDV